MRRTMRMVAICTALLIADLLYAGAGETNQTINLTLDLSDGSRIIGTPAIEAIPLQTDYAKLDIPLRSIRVMVVDPNHETASFTMVNSDKLRGAVTLGPLQLQTIVGAMKVDFAFVTRMTVLSGDGRSLPAALTDTLVLYYSFDEDGRGTVKDNTGKTLPGEVLGAKWTDKGKIGGAYDFDGQSSRITTPPVDTVGEATWSVWVQPRSFPTTHDTCGQFLGVRSRAWAWNSCNTALSFVCGDHFQPSRLALYFHVQGTPSTGGWAGLTFQTRPDLNRWYHVAVVLDSSGMHLYLDAKLIAESADKTKIPVPSPMIVGCNDNGPQRFFDGLIDEVMIFKKALTAEEIEMIHTAQR